MARGKNEWPGGNERPGGSTKTQWKTTGLGETERPGGNGKPREETNGLGGETNGLWAHEGQGGNGLHGRKRQSVLENNTTTNTSKSRA